ncbi:actin-like ATPase domain-containing protein [Aspergillus campestris IBT 28561]|uniref:Actin-like ATPase domain-containing protein n=1 Tax=Aspergillus campestris (strain IBT 28561) TaxID=1392248 RepID=A0A2I1D7K3_ASPC2|nr:actin-like ATPase domain-containing protein [Aspergillus campestris IBT 28561]PKY05861.1 actin-like ATPase domain-containing protein [Aspergillus campestris IBT 28561]
MSFRHSQSGRPTTPNSPPHRTNHSSFASSSSATSSFRGEEDAIILEIGSRWLRAGFEGESAPMCVVGCGPEDSRRAGDYRGFLHTTHDGVTAASGSRDPEEWASAYELWKMDLRDLDLGLVEDRIERTIRETYNKYLLTDAGTSRLVLSLPSVMPYPLLSALLSSLFGRWRFPSITLLPTPAMVVLAAGLRSALVVDIGWAETVVTGVYEYREVATKRSTRATKRLLQETGKMLTALSPKGTAPPRPANEISADFELCEEVVSRFAWARPRGDDPELSSVLKKTVSIPCPSSPSTYMDVPFARFADPVGDVFFADGVAENQLDDEEKSLPLLVYHALLALPPDARGLCMSRIVFVGGGSHVAGIRTRVLAEVGSLLDQYGWSAVRGQAIEKQRQQLQRLSLAPRATSPAHGSEGPAVAEEEIDPVEQKLQRNKDKDSQPPVQGVLREVESLGAWAGASLATSLKIRGVVEIEREKYLQHGLAGASRDLESHGHVPDRRSGLRAGGDRSSWTLGGWG